MIDNQTNQDQDPKPTNAPTPKPDPRPEPTTPDRPAIKGDTPPAQPPQKPSEHRQA